VWWYKNLARWNEMENNLARWKMWWYKDEAEFFKIMDIKQATEKAKKI